MSSKSIIDRRRGPKIDVVTGLTKDDDVLVVGLIAPGTDDDRPDARPTLLLSDDLLDDAAADALDEALAALDASGKKGQTVTLPAPAGLPVRLVVAVGLGSVAESQDAENIREAAGNALRGLDGAGTVVSTLSVADLTAAAQGSYLGAYRFDEYRSTPPAKAAPAAVSLVVPQKTKQVKAELEQAVIIADAVALARDFVNTPPNDLYPGEFADRARAVGSAAGLTVEILDEKALEKGGYGGILGVGQGSSRPPRLVRLTYAPSSARSKVALVGKGVTFDTGGISIKPAAGMDHMTSDMGGAAAVIAATVAAARLHLDVAVTATVPMAENMPSDTAQRPGDVLRQYGGTTVEVLNTDAEGRLILADAIVRACEDAPDYLIDTATLTGAQMVALGTRTPGVLGTDEFRDRVARISQEVGERGWPMPMPSELRSDLDSRVADLANVTNHRWGGMLSATLFLREFVADGVGWAHVDVAGPAFNAGGPWGYTQKGGTGVPVRTLIAVLSDIAAAG
ncbi:MAG: leucyl aminopeptidase [Gordonia sp. (in: high G+C Gram-positive bacteria)]|uniref:leucyl aminopeptidase n=1 Tax=Gordonia sp. (in: high G+C Gram-positive bacteria) TaxID=84139 RepID=UPI0039E524D1